MPIRFVCSTITRFDPESNQYIRCESELSVDESLVGTFIVCSHCRQQVLVPQISDSRLDAAAAANRPASRVATAGAGTPPRTAKEPAPAAAGEASPLAFSSFAASKRCKKCGGHLDATRRCVQCGHQATIQASAQAIDSQSVQLAGFQRWLSRFAQQGNASAVLMGLHAMVGLVLVIVVVMGFVGGGLGLIIALTTSATILAAYLYALYDCRRIARRPQARLSWWQSLGWSAMLTICRATSWRWLRGPTPLKVLDLRRQSVSEQQLLARGDLVEYDVIDAEGLPLTDSGLARLKGLRRLQRLVVRGSSVTPEAVFRLQQDLPEAWIWS